MVLAKFSRKIDEIQVLAALFSETIVFYDGSNLLSKVF